MAVVVVIKGKLLTPEEPVICVPVLEHTEADIIAEAKRLVSAGVDMIEWRIDAFTSYADRTAVRDVLEELRELTKEVILLATLRSEEQGGMAKMTPFEKSLIYEEVAQSHCADIIDVEVSTFPDAYDLVKSLQKRGALILASEHDFSSTPPAEKLTEIYGMLSSVDADIVKLAVMAESDSDVDRLKDAAVAFREEHPQLPLISIAMGEAGRRTRIECGAFGSCVTFASGLKDSAPGQIPFEELKEIVH